MQKELIDHLQSILQCPITKKKLRSLQPAEIKEINDKVARRELAHVDGTPVKEIIDSGFISSDNRFAYPVIDNVIILLYSLAIPLHRDGRTSPISIRNEKKIVQDFYNQVGWRKEQDKSSSYHDAQRWEDLRPVVRDYVHLCHLRVNRYFKSSGRYFLDAGSGPIQYPEYMTYSQGYAFRVCLDLSYMALKEAKDKLGDKGIYILGDITNIPLQESSMDAVVSLHTLYHVPKDEQITALRELQRVLKPQATAAVVYSWGHSPMMRWLLFPFVVKRAIQKFILQQVSVVRAFFSHQKSPPAIPHSGKPYFFAHDYQFFTTHLTDIKYEVFVWRSVNAIFTKAYIRDWLFGGVLIKWIYRFEEEFPRLAGRLGQYPLFVIEK